MPAFAAGPLAAPVASAPAGGLSLRFVSVGDAVRADGGGNAFVDIGAVAAHPAPGRGGPIVVRRRVALRLDGPYASARLSVALAADIPGCTVRVDGLAVSSIPRIVNPVHQVGSPVVHDIEMSIPASVAAGPFLSNLQWFAESD
ncbi:MAG: hypothetical protein V4864_01715 [Pseudomonadota bacterium]